MTSAPKFRAYIAARSVVWVPGTTRRPVPGAAERWGWSRSLEDYPILTAEERDRLAYGEAATVRGRTRGDKDVHWRDLPGVVIASEDATLPDGRVGWRIVPAEVSERALTVKREGRVKRERSPKSPSLLTFPVPPLRHRQG